MNHEEMRRIWIPRVTRANFFLAGAALAGLALSIMSEFLQRHAFSSKLLALWLTGTVFVLLLGSITVGLAALLKPGTRQERLRRVLKALLPLAVFAIGVAGLKIWSQNRPGSVSTPVASYLRGTSTYHLTMELRWRDALWNLTPGHLPVTPPPGTPTS